MSKLHHLQAVLTACLMTCLMTCLAAFIAHADEQHTALATIKVAHEIMPSERVVDGTIEAINQATVSAQTSGRITDIFYDVNDFVPAGAVIMRLRGTQQRASMEQAQASLQEAIALNAQSQQQFKRIEGLYKESVATRQEYEQALASRDAAAAHLDSARAAVDAAREGFGYTEVRAPYAGIVTKRLVQVGESVQPGTPLMSGVSLQYLRVNLDLPQSIVEKVREIRKAAIYVGDKRIEAASFTIFPEANIDTHTFHARANLPANATDLHPGMFVKVGVVTGETRKLLIPAGSVVTRSEVTAVYVMQNDQPMLRQIRLGQHINDRVEVLAGLNDGDIVVLDPVAASRMVQQ
ncbi:MAG TPA: efflux RND transporter periplasmic adaptor subunit [Steroidobacteraceae bacterium]|nr:efflux RND transporter periplasmic adaptor subunit [Steroidobacteraceae bacterium]